MRITRKQFEDFILLYVMDTYEQVRKDDLFAGAMDDGVDTYFEEFTTMAKGKGIGRYKYKIPMISRFKYAQWRRKLSSSQSSVFLEIKE